MDSDTSNKIELVSDTTTPNKDDYFDDADAAKLFVKLMDDKLIHGGKENEYYVFNSETNLWYNTKEALLAAVRQHKNSLTIQARDYSDDKIKTFNYGTSQLRIRNMLFLVETFAKKDTSFIWSVWYPQEVKKLYALLEKDYIIKPTDPSDDNYAIARDIKKLIKDSNLLRENKYVSYCGMLPIDALLCKAGFQKGRRYIKGRYLSVWYGLKPRGI